MKLGETIRSQNYSDLGKRDACHSACVLCELCQDAPWPQAIGGIYVRFTGDSFTKIVPSSARDAHGVIDPFIASWSIDDMVWVLLKPGLASSVEHNFAINIDDVKKGEWSCKECQP